MHKILSVIALEDYCILAEFENGERRIFDVKPLFNKKIFFILQDKSIFNQVYVEYGSVTWKDYNGNEIDICSDKLYMDSLLA